MRWLAARLEMLGGPPDATVESHSQAITRLIMAQAMRVIAGVIEDLDARG